MAIDERDVLAALGKVMDPELHIDIVKAGMVKDLKVSGADVSVKIELTTPACPMKEQIQKDVEAALASVPGIASRQIDWGALVQADQALIWRGPMLHGALMQLVRDVDWGELDYLVLDLPPGTGDVALSISQQVQAAGAVLVTTPQDVALADVVRAKAMFDKVS